MKECPACSFPLAEICNFCPNCGTKILPGSEDVGESPRQHCGAEGKRTVMAALARAIGQVAEMKRRKEAVDMSESGKVSIGNLAIALERVESTARNAAFSIELRGYDQDEVDPFIDTISSSICVAKQNLEETTPDLAGCADQLHSCICSLSQASFSHTRKGYSVENVDLLNERVLAVLTLVLDQIEASIDKQPRNPEVLEHEEGNGVYPVDVEAPQSVVISEPDSPYTPQGEQTDQVEQEVTGKSSQTAHEDEVCSWGDVWKKF